MEKKEVINQLNSIVSQIARLEAEIASLTFAFAQLKDRLDELVKEVEPFDKFNELT